MCYKSCKCSGEVFGDVKEKKNPDGEHTNAELRTMQERKEVRDDGVLGRVEGLGG